MSLITVGSGAPESELEPGTYPASLAALSQKRINVRGEDSDVFEWVFHIPVQDGGDPIPVNGLTSTMTGPKSKTWAFLQALLGPQAVEPGKQFGPDDLVGKEALVNVELNANGYPKVTGIVAMPKSMARPAAPAATATPTPAAPAAPRRTVAQAVQPDAEGTDDDLPF